METNAIPSAFFWRRFHSLAGVWLVVFLFQHLLTNSQAALWIGGDGEGFIHSVNSIHELPYLPVIEIALLLVPFLIHGLWGLKYIRTARFNNLPTNGTTPYLNTGRNRAYTWQRITSWLLLIGIIAHVVHMRFIEYPSGAKVGAQREYLVRLENDQGLATLAKRLDVRLLTPDDLHQLQNGIAPSTDPVVAQETQQRKRWIEAALERPLGPEHVVAVAKDFGTADLLVVRDTFKSPLMIILYSLFVIAACYHAFNGLWTASITWGITLTQKSQAVFLKICYGLMFITMFLGLSAAILTYWVNLWS